MKDYPKDKEYRHLKLSSEITSVLREHIRTNGLGRNDLLSPCLPPNPSRTPRQGEVARVLQLLRRSGATEGELRLLRSYGDVLTVLGRTHEAAEILVPGS